jgi:uncharacterized membrane protein YgcG
MATNKKNILPELSDTIINGSINFYESSEELLNIFKDVSLDIVNFFIELEETKSSDNVLKNLTQKYIDLSNKKLKINETEIPNNFKLYINEKYQNLLSIFKGIIIKNIDDPDKSIFSNYSDDIGMTLEINHNLGLHNSPIYDTYYNLEKNGAPLTIPPIMYNKVSKNLLKNFKKMSLKNDALLKRNLRNIAGYTLENISKTPHGANLVYDNFSLSTREELTNLKTEKIFHIYGENLGDLITFYKNLNIREQKINKSYLVKYKNNIEGVENILDTFNNNVYSTAYLNNPTNVDVFIPHNMYDPVTGAVYYASTEALHLEFSALGYTHTRPDITPESGTTTTIQTTQSTIPAPQPTTDTGGSTGGGSTGGGSYSGGSGSSDGGGY